MSRYIKQFGTVAGVAEGSRTSAVEIWIGIRSDLPRARILAAGFTPCDGMTDDEIRSSGVQEFLEIDGNEKAIARLGIHP